MTEAFSFLKPVSGLPGFHPAWIPRIPGVDVLGDREFALRNLAPTHDHLVSEQFPEILSRHHAEQVHGREISLIAESSDAALITHPGADGLVTRLTGQLLAVYVADCAAIYLADPVKRAIGLLHSGKKGTELGILPHAVSLMKSEFGTNPADLVCLISPCIRPPDYDIDFAATIRQQAKDSGIRTVHDSQENTATDLTRHYSYRIEKGRTGRMLALLSMTEA